MSLYHSNESHWYLPLIGVDPFYHGKRLGSALMQYAIVVCELDQNFAYLKSFNPKNISFYKLHRFELLQNSGKYITTYLSNVA